MNDRDIRFDIVARNIKFNEVWHQVFTLDEIWDGNTIDTWLKSSNCEMLAKRQWTGLKDKNGAGIYDGDVCEIQQPTSINRGTISFLEGAFAFTSGIQSYGQRTIVFLHSVRYQNNWKLEVIGNIYDEPELLR